MVRLAAADANEGRGEEVFMYRDYSAAPLMNLKRKLKAVMDALDALVSDEVSLARSVELTVHWMKSQGTIFSWLEMVVLVSLVVLWRNWLREDPLVQPFHWLNLVLPPPFVQCSLHLTPSGSGVLADPARIDGNSESLASLICRSGQRKASLEEFTHEFESSLSLHPEVSLPQLSGEVLAEVVHRKSATAGSLDGWGLEGRGKFWVLTSMLV